MRLESRLPEPWSDLNMKKRISSLSVAILALALSLSARADTISINTYSNQSSFNIFTLPASAYVETHGSLYSDGSLYVANPLGTFNEYGYFMHDGTVPAGTYSFNQQVSGSGYICTIIQFTPPYTISSTTDATVPTNQQRTKVGVGEIVFVTLSPTPSGSVSWAASAGSLASGTSSQVTWTAPDTGANPVTVTATVDGYNYVRTFNVVAPSGTFWERKPGTGIKHTYGLPSAGFQANTYLTPDDVSFTRIETREQAVNAIATGYFSYENGDPHPLGSWITTDAPTSGKGSLNGYDSIYGQASTAHTPWAAGTFTWNIPWEYRVGTSGTAHQFTTLTHLKQMVDSSGSVTISKGGVSVTTALNDATSNY